MVGAWVKLGLVLGLGVTRQLPPRKIASRLGLVLGWGEGFSLRAIVLELFDNEVEVLDRTSLACLLFDNFVWII